MKKTIAVAASVLLSGLICMSAFGAESEDHNEYGIPDYDPTKIVEDEETYLNGRVAKEPTCTEDGWYRYDCTEPGSSVYFHEVKLPALGHDYEETVTITKQPTCTEAGEETHTFKCTRCGDTYTEKKTIPANGHVWSSEVDGENWGRVTKEPTCTEEGEAVDYCTVCGELNTFVEPRILEKTDHSFVVYVQDSFEKATCINEGYETGHFECEFCGAVDPDNKVDEHWNWNDPGDEADEFNEAHKWVTPVVEEEPTCAETGKAVQWCTRCGNKRETVIPTLDPEYEVTSRLLNCYQEEITKECKNCKGEAHETTVEVVDTRAHTFKDRTEDIDKEKSKAPDCTHYGYTVYRCVHYYDEGNDQDKHDEEFDPLVLVYSDKDTNKDVTTDIPQYEGYDVKVLAPTGHKWTNWEKRYSQDGSTYWYRECLNEGCGLHDEMVTTTDVKDIKAATCTEPGAIYYYDGHEEEIPALGHTVAEDPAVEPTCTETGLTAGSHCATCGEVLEAQEEIPALGHDYEEEVIVAVSCTKEGLIRKTCSVCGDMKYETVEATGHTPVEIPAVEPTKESAGSTAGTKCEVCGEILEAPEEIPMISITDVVDPTCTEEGKKVYSDGSEEVIPALGHDEVEDAAAEPTCTEAGKTAGSHCARCGEVIVAQEEIPATGHNYEEETLIDVTCTKDGLIRKTCTECGNVYYEVVKATGHTPVEIPAVDPTTEDPGHTAGVKCDVCGEVLEAPEEIPMITVVNVVRATCTEDGKVIYSDGTEEVVPATGHDVVEDEAVEPTCTEAGKTAGSHCANCGEVFEAQEEIPALGHDAVEDAGVEPTCTEAGKTAGSHCETCGEILVAQEEVPALGHNVVEDEALAATCTEAGKTAGSHCDRCGEVLVEQEDVPALGHTVVEIPAVPATKDSAGHTVGYKCEVCGEILVEPEEIPMLKDGFILDEDGKWRLYDNGEVAADFTGIYAYNGGEFFLNRGVLEEDASGLNYIDDTWYFLANGQVQRVDGFAEYDDNWFMIKNGVLDQDANGLYTYKTNEGEGVFLFAAGRLRTDVNGLWQDAYGTYGEAGKWYFLANGQVVDYTGVAEYNGAFFVVEKGVFNNNYNGTIKYDGATFNVVAGQLYDQVKTAEAA